MRSRFVPVLASLAILFTAAVPVAGNEETGEPDPPRRGRGPQIEMPNDGDEYSGPSSAVHQTFGSRCLPGRMCPQHASVMYHYHHVTGHTREWDGYIDRRTGMACKGPCTLSTTVSVQWSNRWGASIGFDKGAVSGSVGFDVSHSASYSYSFSFAVPRGSTREIWYRDWYHVTDLSLRTDWLASFPPYPVIRREYGTGWAGEWYVRVYSARRV